MFWERPDALVIGGGAAAAVAALEARKKCHVMMISKDRNIDHHFLQFTHRCKEFSEKKRPVGKNLSTIPTQHFCMGEVRIDSQGRTVYTNLFCGR